MILKDLKLYQENNKYYLSAILYYENEKGIYEMSIPKIALPISPDIEVNLESYYDIWTKITKTGNVDFGFGRLSIKPFDDEGNLLTMTCIEEKVHKMTLAEIEKELGYKIELQKETNI